MADGEFGVSVDDIVYSYHGNRNSSKLEVKLNGSMKDKAIDKDRIVLIKWAREGAKQKEWKTVEPILEVNCIQCHGTIPGLPTYSSYEESAEVAKTDMDASVSSIARVSHIHLFCIAYIFIFLGYVFSMSIGMSKVVKSIIITIPFGFLIIDISSWWITSIYPGFTWLIIIGGFGYIMAFSIMWFT